MRIRQLGSVLGTAESRQHLTTFLVNEAIAFDAGSLGLLAPLAQQRRVKRVFLSHSHIDHLATLPVFLDNVFQSGGECPAIYASRDVWDCLNDDVLNERLWPNLNRIATGESRFYTAAELESEVPVTADGLTITPVSVNHTVPTHGFLIEDERAAAVIASDTGPTERLWELARRPRFRQKLRVVFLECSFPSSYAWLADESRHLCPSLFAAEIAKLSPDGSFQTVAVHLKAALDEAIRAELETLALPNFVIGGQDQTWDV